MAAARPPSTARFPCPQQSVEFAGIRHESCRVVATPLTTKHTSRGLRDLLEE